MDGMRIWAVWYMQGHFWGVLYHTDGDGCTVIDRACNFHGAADAAEALCDIVAGESAEAIYAAYPNSASARRDARGYELAYLPVDADGYNLDAPGFEDDYYLNQIPAVKAFCSAYDADYQAWDATCY